MASGAVKSNGQSGIADLLLALVAEEGSLAHPYPGAPVLREGASAWRNLADVVHTFCTLHGRHPGVIDLAAENPHPAAAAWLEQARPAFAVERSLLARLVVAAGPAPSTPGQAQTEAALFGQRHALETLARSERNGCALGAAMALALDWRAIRGVLDLAADRFGVSSEVLTLPSIDDTTHTIGAVAETVAVERALFFGAQQLLLQHRGLWTLLEAREAARRAHG